MNEFEVINSLASGHFISELHKALILTAEECIETHKAGSITVTLKIIPTSDVTVVVNEDLKRKPPTKDPHGAMYFAIGDGLLHKADPRQTAMELRMVEGGKSELVQVEAKTTTREVGAS